ncbi:hypothetical protein [Mangrovicoccus sp. HB161399]|uniref:hypothetical protein n=1 Tax=Mangrovicoccus sp. HB161399 TaxID=2720392 RepID=UPI001557F1DA|nr:hypothetical protein [Mangrovicoccus sp. HB161399]
MTALTQYQRLEAPGVWHESPDSQRKDVFVSLGEATLVINDRSDAALTHWSLAAIRRIAPGNDPAIYAPGPEDDERLELTDPDMIAAIDTVRRAVARSQPRSGALRVFLTLCLFAAALAAAVLWLPGALVTHTAQALPEATRQDIGRRLVIALEPYSGRPCRDIPGRRALGKLQKRLFGDAPWELRVLENGTDVKALPGGILVIGGELLSEEDGPDVVAGHLLAAAAMSAEEDPMVWFLELAGPWHTFRMLTTGVVPQELMGQAADALALGQLPPALVPGLADPDPVLQRFSEAELSSGPYGRSALPGGDAWIEMIEGDPYPGGTPVPVLSDADWLRLQSVCS